MNYSNLGTYIVCFILVFCIVIGQDLESLGSSLFVHLILSVVLVVDELTYLIFESLVSSNADCHRLSIRAQAQSHVRDRAIRSLSM